MRCHNKKKMKSIETWPQWAEKTIIDKKNVIYTIKNMINNENWIILLNQSVCRSVCQPRSSLLISKNTERRSRMKEKSSPMTLFPVTQIESLRPRCFSWELNKKFFKRTNNKRVTGKPDEVRVWKLLCQFKRIIQAMRIDTTYFSILQEHRLVVRWQRARCKDGRHEA